MLISRSAARLSESAQTSALTRCDVRIQVSQQLDVQSVQIVTAPEDRSKHKLFSSAHHRLLSVPLALAHPCVVCPLIVCIFGAAVAQEVRGAVVWQLEGRWFDPPGSSPS